MRPLREALLLLLVAAAPAALAVLFHPQLADRSHAGLEPGAVRLADALAWQPPPLWIDGRSEADFAADHIPGALPLGEAQFTAQLGPILAAWQPGQRIVVYCSSASCTASKTLAQRLRDAGLTDVHHLQGGWEAWAAARP